MTPYWTPYCSTRYISLHCVPGYIMNRPRSSQDHEQFISKQSHDIQIDGIEHTDDEHKQITASRSKLRMKRNLSHIAVLKKCLMEQYGLSKNPMKQPSMIKSLICPESILLMHSSLTSNIIVPSDDKICFMYQHTSLLAQIVCEFKFNHMSKADLDDEFFGSTINETHDGLNMLIISIIDLQEHIRLTRYTVNYALLHWFTVCRFHLLRAWLNKPIRTEYFIYPSISLPNVCQLLTHYGELLKKIPDSNSIQQLISKCLHLMEQINFKQISLTCYPQIAQVIYRETALFYLKINIQNGLICSRRRLQNYILNNIMLLEAHSRSACREIRDLKAMMSKVNGLDSPGENEIFESVIQPGTHQDLQLNYSRKFSQYLHLIYIFSEVTGYTIMFSLIALFLLICNQFNTYLPENSKFSYDIFLFFPAEDLWTFKRVTFIYYGIWAIIFAISYKSKTILTYFTFQYLFRHYDPHDIQKSLYWKRFQLNLSWSLFEYYDRKLVDEYNLMRQIFVTNGFCDVLPIEVV